MADEKKDALVGVRMPKSKLKKLDKLRQGQLSRSQVVRIMIEDFLERPEEEQREILFRRLFGKS